MQSKRVIKKIQIHIFKNNQKKKENLLKNANTRKER